MGQAVPGSFPAYVEPGQSAAHTLAGSDEAMKIFQVTLQQPCRPNRGVIAKGAGISVDYLIQQGVNDTQSTGRTTAARGILQALEEFEVLSLFKGGRPVVNRLSTDFKEVCDIARRQS